MSAIIKSTSRRNATYRALRSVRQRSAPLLRGLLRVFVILWASTKLPRGAQLKRILPTIPKTTIAPFHASSFRLLCALCVSVAIPVLSSAQQSELKIAAAADLKFAMTDLAAAYEKQSGVHLNLTFGSSGNFFAQIQNGAPFDIFFSADSDYPRKLNEAGLVLPNTADSYAIGKLVLWSPASEKVDPSKSNWQSVLDPSVKKIAIANPDHAPYGRAALEALKKSGFYEKIKDKLVLGDNIAQTAQFVQSGNAQIGILAESLILSPSFGPGHSWKIPQQQYTPLIQSVVALKTANKDAARAFLAWIKTPPALVIFQKYGFTKSLPDEHPIPR
jgi:molybdate transport system substrate-binding protein